MDASPQAEPGPELSSQTRPPPRPALLPHLQRRPLPPARPGAYKPVLQSRFFSAPQRRALSSALHGGPRPAVPRAAAPASEPAHEPGCDIQRRLLHDALAPTPTLYQHRRMECRETFLNGKLLAALLAGHRWAQIDLQGIAFALTAQDGDLQQLQARYSSRYTKAMEHLTLYHGKDAAADLRHTLDLEWGRLQDLRRRFCPSAHPGTVSPPVQPAAAPSLPPSAAPSADAGLAAGHAVAPDSAPAGVATAAAVAAPAGLGHPAAGALDHGARASAASAGSAASAASGNAQGDASSCAVAHAALCQHAGGTDYLVMSDVSTDYAAAACPAAMREGEQDAAHDAAGCAPAASAGGGGRQPLVASVPGAQPAGAATGSGGLPLPDGGCAGGNGEAGEAVLGQAAEDRADGRPGGAREGAPCSILLLGRTAAHRKAVHFSERLELPPQAAYS